MNNNIYMNNKKRGFTLLEILLVIAAIGIIASIVIVSINPLRQIGKARNASRYANINTIQKALDQYNINNGRYPSGITGSYQEICVDGNTTNCIDLESDLVPTYIAEIPKDPEGGGYKVAISRENNKVSLLADKADLEQDISINLILYAVGEVDEEFNSNGGFNLSVVAIEIQEDNKMLAVGDFTEYQGVGANRIIRLNSDGSRDDSFDIGVGFNNIVRSIKIQTDGKYIVAGDFTEYQGVSANRIIRLNSDGSRDNSFDIGVGFDIDIGVSYNSYVAKIHIQDDGKIIVGGDFTIYQGVSANRIIRLNSDGSRDNTFDIGVGFDNWVRTIESQSDGKVLIGGWFSEYQGVSANRIVRLNSDGSRDNTFDIGVGFNGNSLRFIKIQADGKYIIAGDFSQYQGINANRMIILNSDGSRDNSFDVGQGFPNTVNNVIRYGNIQGDGKIIVVGDFTEYQGVSTNGIVRLNSDGSRDNSFDIGNGFNDNVLDLKVKNDNKLVLSGSFTEYNGVVSNRIVILK